MTSPSTRSSSPLSRHRARGVLGAALVVVALALALAPLPATWIERVYTNGLHPAIQHATTGVTNLVPVPLGDLVFAGAILALLVVWWASLRTARRVGFARALGAAFLRTAVLAAGAYLV